MRFGLRLGKVFGRFWAPKRSGKRSGTGRFGTSEKHGFAKAPKTHGTQIPPAKLNGDRRLGTVLRVIQLIRSNLSIYLSIDLLLVALISMAKFLGDGVLKAQ